MALFDDTEGTNIETIKAGCPICHSDVKGNEIYDYLCKNCNILFKKKHLRLSPERVEQLIKEKVIKRFDKNKDRIKIDEKISVKEVKKYYVVSKKSNILHTNNCPFAKNIKKENITKYNSMERAKYDKKCKCTE